MPKSLGGQNGNNLVLLTAKEHFICHLLLIKMTEGIFKRKMFYAFMNMKTNNKHKKRYNSKLYNFHKQHYSNSMSGINHPRYGRKWSKEQKEFISKQTKIAMVGKKEILSKIHKGKIFSEETKEKMSKSRKHKIWISNHKDKTTKMINKIQLDIFINDGWVVGRLYNNPFIGSNTNYRHSRI